jgi:hypothetical protein
MIWQGLYCLQLRLIHPRHIQIESADLHATL